MVAGRQLGDRRGQRPDPAGDGSTLGIDRRAHVPPFMDTPLVNQAPGIVPPPNPGWPGLRRKVAIYAGCHDNFNDGTPAGPR
jgi:hypothetical protein